MWGQNVERDVQGKVSGRRRGRRGGWEEHPRVSKRDQQPGEGPGHSLTLPISARRVLEMPNGPGTE